MAAPGRDTRRVSLRRRLAAVEGGGASDVVGHVIAEADDEIVLLPESSGPVAVPRAAITALREVPEQAVRPSSSPDKIERMLDRTWLGIERARLGGWVLRASRGVTGRANSVLVAGDPGVDIERAIELAAQFYDRHGLPMRFQVVLGEEGGPQGLPTRPGGWTLRGGADVLVTDLRRVDVAGASTVDAEWRFSEAPDDAWFSLWRGGGTTDDARSEVTAAPAVFVTCLGDDGAPVAVGRIGLTADWCVLSCLDVAPHRRRAGIGRATTFAMLEYARARGARFAALQVEDGNDAATALYEGLGFTKHHRYAYAV